MKHSKGNSFNVATKCFNFAIIWPPIPFSHFDLSQRSLHIFFKVIFRGIPKIDGVI